MSDRWQLVTDLFDAARRLDPAAREAFLEAACGADRELHEEVRSLLEQHRSADGFLARPPVPGLAAEVSRIAAELEAGEVLSNRYRIESRLAGGGQATLYRASDQVLSRPVVIKVLRTEGREDGSLRSRLLQEMEALSRIDHPAVVGILDTGTLEDGSPFLVIQYIEGQSLREALRNGPLDRARTAAILRQIGAALSATHAAGIAHRDLKPENVMLQRLSDGSDAVKLIDFGIAKVERSRLAPEVTTVMIAGTVRYMAPEQFQGENSTASDVYALGLLACEMLCGQPDLRALGGRVGRRAQRLLESALEFRPEARPRNVRQWCDRIADALTATGRRRFLIAASGAMAASAGGWAVASRLRPSPEDTARVIEKVGAFDPLTEGFQPHDELTGTVTWNSDRTALEGWRVTSPSQGYYYRRLSGRQKRMAMERGFSLSAEILAQEGVSLADADIAGLGPRFTLNVIAERDADLVRLVTQVVPAFQGLEVRLPRTAPIYRRYDLRYDPGLQAAALWVDGQKVLAGYRGLRQYQDDMGVAFGAVILASERGVGTFKSVRFEINP